MPSYLDLDGDSGVSSYDLSPDSITVHFKDGAVYLYTYSSAGAHNIEQMKVLAVRGDGLNAFISQHVRKRYARGLH